MVQGQLGQQFVGVVGRDARRVFGGQTGGKLPVQLQLFASAGVGPLREDLSVRPTAAAEEEKLAAATTARARASRSARIAFGRKARRRSEAEQFRQPIGRFSVWRAVLLLGWLSARVGVKESWARDQGLCRISADAEFFRERMGGRS